MLRTILVLPTGRSTHLESNVDLVVLSQDGTALLAKSRLGVADELVEVIVRVGLEREALSKRIVVEDLVETLLMESFDVDVGGNGVALSFRVRKPRLLRSSDTRIMNAAAALSKGTVCIERVILRRIVEKTVAKVSAK
jgi:hypothetical protein